MDFIFGTPNPGNNYVYVAGKPAVYIYDNELLQILVPNLSGVAPINFSFVSGEISITQADAITDGYLSSIDWNIFNDKAPINSPAFTGIPTAPTASPGTNTDQIATTAFVLANIQSIENDITNIESSITQPDKQIVYGTGTGLTSNSHFTFDNTLSSNTIARMNIGDSNHQGQIDVTAFGGGSLLRIEAGPQIYFSNFGGNGFIFRPNGAVETMRMINNDLLIGHTSTALGRLDIRRTTIGSNLYVANNSYNLGGSGPIVVSDGSGFAFGIGYSPTTPGYMYFPIGGIYFHGYGVYGTFFESGNVTINNKLLVGSNGYEGNVDNNLLNVKFQVHGGERFIDLAGTGTRMVVADSTGKLSAQAIPSSASGTSNRISVSGSTIDIAATYVGQTSITTLGTITTGTWNGTAIGDSYISSASTWNAKLSSVTGTANRITVTGGSTIDISSSYVGQNTITTLGTITTGVWNGTTIGDSYISSASTWNAKQNALSGTGFVKISGTTISYDNSTYLIKGSMASDEILRYDSGSTSAISSSSFKYDGSTLLLNGGLRQAYTQFSATHTATASEIIIISTKDVTLPTISSSNKGIIYMIKNNNQNPGNNIRVKIPAGSGNTIEYQPSDVTLVDLQGGGGQLNAIWLTCDDSDGNWSIIASHRTN